MSSLNRSPHGSSLNRSPHGSSLNRSPCGSYEQIIYQKNTKFKIIPKLDIDTNLDFQAYIEELKSYYVPHTRCGHLLFWKFDKNTHSIVTDETITEVSIDFKDQLVKIAGWLFDRGFNLDGSFYLRKADSIEYLKVSQNERIIHNYSFVEKLDTSRFYTGYVDDVPLETKIMMDVEDHINSIELYVAIPIGEVTPPKKSKSVWSYFVKLISYTGLVAVCSICIYKSFMEI